MIKVPSFGPQPASILLLGEAPGKTEEEQGKPFVGASGVELTKMLNEAGILRTEVRVSNVCKYRPPGNNMDFWWPQTKANRPEAAVCIDGEYFDPRVAEGLVELERELQDTNPNIIVPMGNLPLWAICRSKGITKWRGSILRPHPGLLLSPNVKVIPTIHPAAVLRKWDWRYLVVQDLRRVRRWRDVSEFPSLEENFLVRPSYQTVILTLQDLLLRAHAGGLRLAVDIETKARHIACLGIAWSKSSAICIPFIASEKPEGYFSLDEEVQVVLLLRSLLTHPNVEVVGQNWQYDCQYIAKYWGFEVNLFLDIMSEHHVQFPGLPKGLDFQSSLYRDLHVYWKDEGKEQGKGSDDTWWHYNCLDCVATYEIAEVLLRNREARPLRSTEYGSPNEIQQRLHWPISRASMRGVRVDTKLREALAFELFEKQREREEWINKVLGQEFNIRSHPQMHKLFYDELGQSKILNRKTMKPTTDSDALNVLAKRDILLRPLCHAIMHARSLGNYVAVCRQQLDSDNRLRCQYTIPGTETFRFASSADPFGYGTNLQNIAPGESPGEGDSEWGTDFPLPNLRRVFIPDEGFILGDFDMPQADARVVAWEAQDEHLIELFLDPSRDLHDENCEVLFGHRPKGPGDLHRYYAKQGVHLTNYGGSPRVLAMTLGIILREAENFQKRWFEAHPKIKEWHRRVAMQLATKRYVENAFGYRRFYFDRIEDLLKEALAWIPQSTVAIATNLGILAVDADAEMRKRHVQLLLQTHDSSTYQWPTWATPLVEPRMVDLLTIRVPYPQPLVLRPGVKKSETSWGDVKKTQQSTAA